MLLIRTIPGRASQWLFVLALLLMSTPAWSQTATETARPEPILPFTQFTLDNGLTVLVREDHKLPIASVTVIYNVGSRDDPPGRNGMAHLFEHLLFYGSQHNPGNFLLTMQRLGGANVNGGTGTDTTNLIETVPISQLDAVLWLESDRMGYLLPALNQKTLTEQIEIIRNEINMDRDEPGGKVRYHIAAGVFPPDHPYHGVAVGDPQELGNITLDDVRNFFKSYYAPSNAAVVIAGDITPSEALEKVKRYFGGLPTGSRPNRVTTWIPELSEDKRERIFDTAPPQLFLVWPMPKFGTIDDVHLRLVGSILMDGASARVRRRLSAAGLNSSDLSWGADARGMAGFFQVSAKAASPAEFRTIERLIRDEIAALAAKGPTGEELERAKRSRTLELRRLAQRTADFNGQSDLLASTWALGDGNAGLLDANMQQMRAATPEDVSAATRRWLDRAAYVLDLEPTVQYRPTSADVDRSRMPEAAPFKPAAFPKTHATTLPNGLNTRHAQWQGGPVVVASLIVRGGAGVDPNDKQGLARLTASLLTAGAGGMSEEELTDELARLDATLQATTDVDTVTLTLVAPKEQIKEALGLLGTVVTAPTFPDAAVERERKKQIQEVQNLANMPHSLSRAVVRRLLYGVGTPYAAEQNGLGTTSGVSNITRADAVDYHRAWFNPANSEIVIVGDVGQAEAVVTGALGRWSNAGSVAGSVAVSQATVVSVPTEAAAPGVYLIDRPGMEQADLTVATLLDAAASPANAPNAVMTNILGGRTSGRINLDLRDLKQWAFWVRGYVEGGRAGQMLLIRTQVQNQRTAEAIAAIKGHLESVKDSKPISPDELQLAKDMLTLSLPLEWETDEGIANAIATSVRQGLPDGVIEKYVTDVRAVTKEQVEQAARRILRPDAMVWVVIGDRSKVEPQLKRAGIAYEVLTPEPPPAPPPPLLIVIAVDQLSADLFDEYRPQFTGGLARLAGGTWFRNGYQSHGSTETCPGYSTILTGARPATTGIIGNAWIDQSVAGSGKGVYCAEGERAPGSSSSDYAVSSVQLKVPTLGELLRKARPAAKSVAISGKDRAAVMMGGHALDQRWYWDGKKFATDLTGATPKSVLRTNAEVATAIGRERKALVPPPFCAGKAQPVTIEGGRVVGNGAFARAAGDADAFRASPEYDAAVLALASALVSELRLGADATPDLLAIGLSATDYVGHTYGTGGQEMCLQLVSLDRDLGNFFTLLDQRGLDFAVVLTADHGALDIPERLQLRGVPTATWAHPALDSAAVGKRIAEKLSLSGPVLRGGVAGDIWLDRSLEPSERARALDEALAIYRGHPQVEAAYSREQISRTPVPRGTPDKWTLLERTRASFYPGRSGDIFVVLKPNITFRLVTDGDAGTHGSPWDYDRRVPIAFWRTGMTPAIREEPVETADIMPTLAAMLGLGVPTPRADGKCLGGITGIACQPR